MKPFLLFLIIASTPFASTDIALASADSERTKAFEFNLIQRYLGANSTIEQEDEERVLTKEQILTAIKEFLPQLSDFSYDSVKIFAKLYFTMTELRLVLTGSRLDVNDFILSSLFTKEFLEELLQAKLCRYTEYIDIALYLVLLEKVGGLTFQAAKQIDQAIYYETKKDIALRMEHGQFYMWSRVLGPENRVRIHVFHSRKDIEWRNAMLERYRDFLANEDKRRIPGVIEASTSRF